MPDPVDVYAGKRLRMRRTILGISQAELGERVGVTFQQIQKYERGSNRMAISRLHQFSRVLKADFQWFVEGYDEAVKTENNFTSESYEILRMLDKIPNHIRKKIIILIKTIAKTEA